MLHQIFTVRDSKAEAYLLPFFAANEAVAKRRFIDAVNDQDHMFFAHAGDYTLFWIGEYDDESGMVDHLATFKNLGNGVEFINRTPGPKSLNSTDEDIE